MAIYVLFLSLALNFLIFKKSRNEDKVFQGILFLSNLYFCGGGYYFWIVIKKTNFVGINWGEIYLIRSILALTLSTFFVALLVFIASHRNVSYQSIKLRSKYEGQVPGALWVFLVFGFLGSCVVFVQGIFGYGYKSGGVFLIAYQFSDLFIPVILFLFALKGINKLNLSLIVYFLIYASLVGFRYKIALLVIPLIILLSYSDIKKSKKILFITVFGFSILVLFSMLTLFRSKFSGLDMGRNIDNFWTELQYGFFAESNILFGLGSIISQYIDKEKYFYINPIYDMVREWVPRFFVPNRETGVYLRPMQLGFLSEEGENSGTAYPYIGEFAIMFGWWGVSLGIVIYAWLYLFLKKLLGSLVIDKRLWFAGLGLIAAIMCYYHYSRGYLPQIAKAYFFVLFPYFYLCAKYKRKFSRLVFRRLQS